MKEKRGQTQRGEGEREKPREREIKELPFANRFPRWLQQPEKSGVPPRPLHVYQVPILDHHLLSQTVLQEGESESDKL